CRETTMIVAINAKGAQLYVGGFSLWGSNSEVISSIIRFRYTGQQSTEPKSFKVRKMGIMLSIGMALDKVSVINSANYGVKRWNYKRTENYGSGHYKLNGEPGEA